MLAYAAVVSAVVRTESVTSFDNSAGSELKRLDGREYSFLSAVVDVVGTIFVLLMTAGNSARSELKRLDGRLYILSAVTLNFNLILISGQQQIKFILYTVLYGS